MSERPLWRLVAGKKTGPYAPEKLRPLVKDGRISPLDRFSYDGESWAAVTAFPELLREPDMPDAPPQEDTFSVRLIDGETSEDDSEPSIPARHDEEDDEVTRRLMKIVKWMVGVGGVLIALLLLMTVFTAVRSPRQQQRQRQPAVVTETLAAGSETLDQQVVRLLKEGKYAEAEPIAKQAVAASEQKNGPDDPSTATSLNNLALLYAKQGEYADAEPLYMRALAIDEKTRGPAHPHTVKVREAPAVMQAERDAELREAEADRDFPANRQPVVPRSAPGPD